MTGSHRICSRFAIALAAVGATAQLAHAEHVLVILDVTGSMGDPSTAGLSRIAVAKKVLTTFLKTVPAEPREYAFWTFEGTSFVRVISFADHRTAADVVNAVNAATLGGGTPLATTVCAAVDELANYLPNEFHDKRIELATDGLENATLPTDQCGGPDSATPYPTLVTGSWQWKVRNKACTGSPTIAGACGGGIPPSGSTLIVDVAHLFDFVHFAAARESADRSRSSSLLATPETDAAFFSGLASETHGTYTEITSATPLNQVAPVPGDANGDGCVNLADRAVVIQQFGTSGTADFNHDGIVNTFDLQTVLQNFGQGCPTTPAP